MPNNSSFSNDYSKFLKIDRIVVALIIYILLAASKRFWLGNLGEINFWFADIFCFVIVPAALVFWICQAEVPFKEFQFSNKNFLKQGYGLLVFQTFICALGLLIAYAIGLMLGNKIHSTYPNALNQTFNYSSRISAVGVYRFLAALYFALTAGLVEEYFFRGLTKKIVSKYTKSNTVFVIVSSLLFGWVHWSAGLNAVVGTTVVGIFLASFYLWTKDLRPIMLSHFLFDFFYFLR